MANSVPAQEIIDRINRENGIDPEPWPTRSEREAETEVVPTVTDDKKSWTPNRKVWSAAVTGAVAILAAYMSEYHGYELNADGTAAVTGILMALTAYFVPEKK